MMLIKYNATGGVPPTAIGVLLVCVALSVFAVAIPSVKQEVETQLAVTDEARTKARRRRRSLNMGDGDDRWRTSSRLSFSDLYGTSEVDLAIRRTSAGMDAWLSDLAVINPLAGDGASPQVVMHTLKLRNAEVMSDITLQMKEDRIVVEKVGPAATLGQELQAGDILESLDGVFLANVPQLRRLIKVTASSQRKQPRQLVIMRARREASARLASATRANPSAPATRRPEPTPAKPTKCAVPVTSVKLPRGDVIAGVTLNDVGERFVVVDAVLPMSPMRRVLKPGHVLVSLDGISISSQRQLARLLKASDLDNRQSPRSLAFCSVGKKCDRCKPAFEKKAPRRRYSHFKSGRLRRFSSITKGETSRPFRQPKFAARESDDFGERKSELVDEEDERSDAYGFGADALDEDAGDDDDDDDDANGDHDAADDDAPTPADEVSLQPGSLVRFPFGGEDVVAECVEVEEPQRVLLRFVNWDAPDEWSEIRGLVGNKGELHIGGERLSCFVDREGADDPAGDDGALLAGVGLSLHFFVEGTHVEAKIEQFASSNMELGAPPVGAHLAFVLDGAEIAAEVVALLDGDGAERRAQLRVTNYDAPDQFVTFFAGRTLVLSDEDEHEIEFAVARLPAGLQATVSLEFVNWDATSQQADLTVGAFAGSKADGTIRFDGADLPFTWNKPVRKAAAARAPKRSEVAKGRKRVTVRA